MKKHYLGLILIGSLYFSVACQPKSEETKAAEGQEQSEEKETEQRPSPLLVAEGQVAGKSIKVQYGSPAVKSRTIWGDLVPYNVVWRTGANEATYIDLPEAVAVEIGRASWREKHLLRASIRFSPSPKKVDPGP